MADENTTELTDDRLQIKKYYMGFGFEKLDVYSKAVNFASKIYRISKNFPASEIYGLTGQLRRASVSISANIAEGNGRHTMKDFVQFIRIARGSVYECIPLLEISLNEKYITQSIHKELIEDCNTIAKMLNGLIRSLSKSE